MSRSARGTTKTTLARPNKNRRATDAARIKAQLEFLQRLEREKEEAWAAMTPAQRREAVAEWKRLVKSLNEGRYGKVILE